MRKKCVSKRLTRRQATQDVSDNNIDMISPIKTRTQRTEKEEIDNESILNYDQFLKIIRTYDNYKEMIHICIKTKKKSTPRQKRKSQFMISEYIEDPTDDTEHRTRRGRQLNKNKIEMSETNSIAEDKPRKRLKKGLLEEEKIEPNNKRYRKFRLDVDVKELMVGTTNKRGVKILELGNVKVQDIKIMIPNFKFIDLDDIESDEDEDELSDHYYLNLHRPFEEKEQREVEEWWKQREEELARTQRKKKKDKIENNKETEEIKSADDERTETEIEIEKPKKKLLNRKRKRNDNQEFDIIIEIDI
jgi:hypothetical protein